MLFAAFFCGARHHNPDRADAFFARVLIFVFSCGESLESISVFTAGGSIINESNNAFTGGGHIGYNCNSAMRWSVLKLISITSD
jgi:hypothetical protein